MESKAVEREHRKEWRVGIISDPGDFHVQVSWFQEPFLPSHLRLVLCLEDKRSFSREKWSLLGQNCLTWSGWSYFFSFLSQELMTLIHTVTKIDHLVLKLYDLYELLQGMQLISWVVLEAVSRPTCLPRWVLQCIVKWGVGIETKIKDPF